MAVKEIVPPYRHLILAALVIISLVSFLAFRPQATTQSEEPQQVNQSGTAALFVETLKNRSLDVNVVGDVSVLYDATQNSSLGTGQRLKVNNHELQLYEFPTQQDAEDTASQINPDGYTIGTSIVDWVAPPHFFKKDNVIVVYIGTDSATLDTLQSEFGPQFAGQE